MRKQTATAISGRMIGALRLVTLIKALELEIKGLKGRVNAYMTLKRELRCKGSRQGVLDYARTVLAEIKDW